MKVIRVAPCTHHYDRRARQETPQGETAEEILSNMQKFADFMRITDATLEKKKP